MFLGIIRKGMNAEVDNWSALDTPIAVILCSVNPFLNARRIGEELRDTLEITENIEI